jgi:hypothetical protein
MIADFILQWMKTDMNNTLSLSFFGWGIDMQLDITGELCVIVLAKGTTAGVNLHEESSKVLQSLEISVLKLAGLWRMEHQVLVGWFSCGLNMCII